MNFCKMEPSAKGYSYRRSGPNVKVIGIKHDASYDNVKTLAAKALQVNADDKVLVYSGAIIPSDDEWMIGKYLEDCGVWKNRHKMVIGLADNESFGSCSDVIRFSSVK